MIAWLFSIVLFWKYLPKKGWKTHQRNAGCILTAGTMAFGPCSAVGSIVGFTSIVQTLPEFQAMLDGVFNFNMPAALILIIAVCLIAALTSSSTAAIRVAVPMVAERCTAAGLSLAFIHRVSCFACSIVDTLPYGTAVIINLGIADLDMKEGYPPCSSLLHWRPLAAPSSAHSLCICSLLCHDRVFFETCEIFVE